MTKMISIMTVPLAVPLGVSIDSSLKSSAQVSSSVSHGVLHGYIVAFDHIWEYGNKGLHKSCYHSRQVRHEESEVSRQNTTRNLEQFDQWFNSNETKQKFSIETYDIWHWNSLVFVKHACEFLGIEYPESFQSILRDMPRNNRKARYVTAIVGGSLTAAASVACMSTGIGTIPLAIGASAIMLGGYIGLARDFPNQSKNHKN